KRLMSSRAISAKQEIALILMMCILFLLPHTSAAQEISSPPVPKGPISETVIQGIELLYDLQFDRAEALFSKVVAQRPKDPAGYFYLAMVTWSRLSSGFWLPEVVEEYGDRIDRVITVAKTKIANKEDDCFTYFYLGGALGFKARFELMQRKWLSSYNLAYGAIEALKRCSEMAPTNKDLLLGLGIFDYYTARLSGVLKFLTYLFLHKGNKEEGLKKLQIVADEGTFSNIEAKSMLIHIYLFLEEDYQQALPLTEELATRFLNNPRHKFFEGVIHIRMGNASGYNEALAYLRTRSRKEGSRLQARIWGNQALYLEASYHLFRNEYDQARSKLGVILLQADPSSDPDMVAWPLLKKGMSYDLEGNREKALEYYNGILKMENGAGAQFLAEKYNDTPAQKGDPFLGY
ncbi:MAG: hypothetical protein MUO52_10785, partial [Desulfobacterales bacterium]|nr:hypothetical protein [Desulfobacterales bacterium]